MFSVSSCIATLAVLLALPAGSHAAGAGALRVCADPNNLPFSNDAQQGFENELAKLLARDLDESVEYVWWPQRRGFIRNTLNAGRCDIVMGVPAGYELVATTEPYYSSTYAFVYRADRGLEIRSFDDPRLRSLRIGVHVVGDDYANVPPAEALARRGIKDNLIGYSIYGDYSKPDPPADLIRAVASGEVDVAIAWGPLAGYFAARVGPPLTVIPVEPESSLRTAGLTFDIAMGVRHGDTALLATLNRFIRRRRKNILRLLERYGTPLVARAGASDAGGR